jgi:hypothetical protein
MRVFRAVVEPTANFATVGFGDLFHRCEVRASPSVTTLWGSYFVNNSFQKLERPQPCSASQVTTVSKTSPS